jgi:GntR family transcriptional regulator
VAGPLDRGQSPLEELDNVSLADRARSAILQAILEDRFGPRLPAEEELAKMLNVSRTTIRAALQSLEKDGMVARLRAVGTTINKHVGPSALLLQRLVPFDWLLRDLGHEVAVTIEWERRAVGDGLAEIFDLPPATEACVMDKEYFADGALAVYIQDVVPWDRIEDSAFEDPLPVSVFDFCDRYGDRPIDHAVVEMVPMVKRDGDTTHLPLESGTPFIRLHETHYARGAKQSAFSMIDVDADYIRFKVFRRP